MRFFLSSSCGFPPSFLLLILASCLAGHLAPNRDSVVFGDSAEQLGLRGKRPRLRQGTTRTRSVTWSFDLVRLCRIYDGLRNMISARLEAGYVLNLPTGRLSHRAQLSPSVAAMDLLPELVNARLILHQASGLQHRYRTGVTLKDVDNLGSAFDFDMSVLIGD